MNILSFLIAPAMAQAILANPPTSLDWTSIAVAVVGGIVSVVGSVGVALINSRMRDSAAREVLANALTNSLGAIQNLIDTSLKSNAPIPPVAMAAAVKYVQDNAGPEMKRLGVLPSALPGKITAQVGRAKMATFPFNI